MGLQRGCVVVTRAAATAYAISLAREHLGDYVPTADVTLTTSREPTTAIGCGVRLVVTLTVVVDDPDAAAEAVSMPAEVAP